MEEKQNIYKNTLEVWILDSKQIAKDGGNMSILAGKIKYERGYTKVSHEHLIEDDCICLTKSHSVLISFSFDCC